MRRFAALLLVAVLLIALVLRLLPDANDRKAISSERLLPRERTHIFLGSGCYTAWWLLPEEDGDNIYPKAVFPDGKIGFHGRNIYHSDFTIRPCIRVRLTEEFPGSILKRKKEYPSVVFGFAEEPDEEELRELIRKRDETFYKAGYIRTASGRFIKPEKNIRYFRLNSGQLLKLDYERLTCFRYNENEKAWKEDSALFSEYEWGNLLGQLISSDEAKKITYEPGSDIKLQSIGDIMYGAFIGDIVGSKYEFNNIRTKDFPLFSAGCDYTDDTIMTVAVAKALLDALEERQKGGNKALREFMIYEMQSFGRKYPDPKGAYGGHFAQWLRSSDPKPYGSYGNGSAMRVSACGIIAVTLEEAQELAFISASVSHDHPEGIKGAQAVASAVFLAGAGKTKEDIRSFISRNFYPLDFKLDDIRGHYTFDVSCQGSVPQAIEAFLESESFEDAIRNVISIGGDGDTTGAMTGAIAWAYYSRRENMRENMENIKKRALEYLPSEFTNIAERLGSAAEKRNKEYTDGCLSPILSSEEKTAAAIRKEQQ